MHSTFCREDGSSPSRHRQKMAPSYLPQLSSHPSAFCKLVWTNIRVWLADWSIHNTRRMLSIISDWKEDKGEAPWIAGNTNICVQPNIFMLTWKPPTAAPNSDIVAFSDMPINRRPSNQLLCSARKYRCTNCSNTSSIIYYQLFTTGAFNWNYWQPCVSNRAPVMRQYLLCSA